MKRNGLSVPPGTRAGSSRGKYKTGVNKKCPCGTVIRGAVKYCSSPCRKKFGRYKKANPPRVAICLGCGEEFTRPYSYPSKMKYCSNECAKREQKKAWGKVGVKTHDGVLILRSMYELRFVAVCERRGWDWRNYDGEAIQTSDGSYRPDFIIDRGNGEEIVEVKGYYEGDVPWKVKEAQDQGYKVWLVDQAVLKELE